MSCLEVVMLLDEVVILSGQLLVESLESLVICHQLVKAASTLIACTTDLEIF